MSKDSVRELRLVLAAERACLISGKLEQLTEIAQRKILVADKIQAVPPDLHRLHEVLAMAKENQTLVLEALKGVQAAQSRLTAIRKSGLGMASYTARGEFKLLDQGLCRIEKRS